MNLKKLFGDKENVSNYVDNPEFFQYAGDGKIGEILRQGDLTFMRIATLPSGLRTLDSNVIAVGEGRNHFHKAKGESVQVLEPARLVQIDVGGHMEDLFKVVKSEQTFDVAHELPNGERANHYTLKGIPKGLFAVFRERELDVFAKEGETVRTVYD